MKPNISFNNISYSKSFDKSEAPFFVAVTPHEPTKTFFGDFTAKILKFTKKYRKSPSIGGNKKIIKSNISKSITKPVSKSVTKPVSKVTKPVSKVTKQVTKSITKQVSKVTKPVKSK